MKPMRIHDLATDIHKRSGWTGKKLELAVVLVGLILAAGHNHTEATNWFIGRADSLASRKEQAGLLVELRELYREPQQEAGP